MACFATPFGLRYAAHCFNRAHAQQSGSALIPAGGKLGVTSNPFDELTWPSIAEGYLLVAQKAVSDALVALERANSVGWTKHGQ